LTPLVVDNVVKVVGFVDENVVFVLVRWKNETSIVAANVRHKIWQKSFRFFHSLSNFTPPTFFLSLKSCVATFDFNVRFFKLPLMKTLYYRAFHEFGQAEFAYGASISGLSQFSQLSQLPQKMMLDLNVVKINSNLIIKLC